MFFYAKVRNGDLDFDNKKAIREFLLSIEDKSVFIQIDKEFGVRSSNQNQWYWGVVLKTIADATGHHENDLHELFKKMFMPPVQKRIMGKDLLIAKSTTSLNKVEFGDYIERIRAFAGEWEIIIPDPIK